MSAPDLDTLGQGNEPIENLNSAPSSSSTAVALHTQPSNQAVNRPHPRSSVMSHHHHHHHHHRTGGKPGVNHQNANNNGNVRNHQAGRYNHHRDDLHPNQPLAPAHASSSNVHLAAAASAPLHSSSMTTTSSSSLFMDPFHTFDTLDLQTPRAFVVVVGLILLGVAGIKSYQHVANKVRQRHRLIESEKAAEELLRLNVKHGVVDLDGQVIKPGSGAGNAGGAAAGTAGSNKREGDAADGKKRTRSGTLEKDSKTRSTSDNPAHHATLSTSEKSLKSKTLNPESTQPARSAATTTITTDREEAGQEHSLEGTLGKAAAAAKNEAKKAKKKIKRAARLEQRKHSGDLLIVDADGDADVDADDVDLDVVKDKQGVEKREEQEQEHGVTVVNQVEIDTMDVEANVEADEDEQNSDVDAEGIQTVEAEETGQDEPPADTVVQVEGDPTLKSTPAEEEPSPMPFIQNMPSIEIQHIPLPDSPPPSRLGRRASDVSDSAASLLSGASSGLSGNPTLHQHLEKCHPTELSTPSDQPRQKRKKKAKALSSTATATTGIKRAVPGAENWVKESHEEREREAKEQLVRQVEKARAASTSAAARTSKVEKENETLTARLHKLESKLSKVTSSQHDLREREKTALWEKEEAIKRANEAQSVMQNYRKVEASLKHDLQVARKERDKTWQDAQRKEADLRSQLQQMNAQLAQAVHSAASFEAALRSTGRIPGTPVFGAPVPLMSSPVGLPNHHGHMLLGNPLPNQSRMSLSTPPSPQSMMSANGLPWIDRNNMPSPGGAPSRKRSPSEVFGLPMMHPLSSATTPVRESSLAWTVLKNKGENGITNPPANLNPTANESSNEQPSPAIRSRSDTVGNEIPTETRDKENEPPIENGGSIVSESKSLPSIIKSKRDDDVKDVPALENVDVQKAPDSPAAVDGEEEVPFFVFPSIHHDPEHVKAAMAERGRRASLQRATSGLSALASPSVSPGKTPTKKVELDDIGSNDHGEMAIYDQSSTTSMTDSRGSTAFSSESQHGDDAARLDITSLKQPELARVNESPEQAAPISVQ